MPGQSRRSSAIVAHAATAHLGVGIIATGALTGVRTDRAAGWAVPLPPLEQPATPAASKTAGTARLTTRLRARRTRTHRHPYLGSTDKLASRRFATRSSPGESRRLPDHAVAPTAGVAGNVNCALYVLPSAGTAECSFAFEMRQRFQSVLLLRTGLATNPTSTCRGGTTNDPSCSPNRFGRLYDAVQSLTIGFEQFRYPPRSCAHVQPAGRFTPRLATRITRPAGAAAPTEVTTRAPAAAAHKQARQEPQETAASRRLPSGTPILLTDQLTQTIRSSRRFES